MFYLQNRKRIMKDKLRAFPKKEIHYLKYKWKNHNIHSQAQT